MGRWPRTPAPARARSRGELGACRPGRGTPRARCAPRAARVTRPGTRAGRRRRRGGRARSAGRGGTRRARRSTASSRFADARPNATLTPGGDRCAVAPRRRAAQSRRSTWIGGSWRSDSSTAVGHQVRVGPQSLEQRRVGAHGLEQVADEVPGRLVARHEQERELRAHLEVGEALAVDLGGEQPGDEVVGRIGRGFAALGDHPVEVRGELGRDAGEPLVLLAVLAAVLRRVRALHDDVGPLGELRVVGRVDAEQVRDHGRRDRRDVLGHEVAAALARAARRAGRRTTSRANGSTRPIRCCAIAELMILRIFPCRGSGISLMSCSSGGTTTPGSRKLAWNASMFFVAASTSS